MDRFSSLANELLLQIAENLQDSPRDLAALSLVCSNLAEVAQSVLYRAIVLRSGRSEMSTRKFAMLVQTLLARRELAQNIRTLKFDVAFKHRADHPQWAGYRWNGLEVVNRQCHAYIQSFETADNDLGALTVGWQDNITRSRQISYSAVLLALASNLVELDIEVLNDD
jgi:hypothetical protein